MLNNALFLEKLTLVNFKNHKQAELDFSKNVNCIIGRNGSGKTNILDAVFYLSMCKSYLNPIDSQNINFDEKFFVIQGTFFTKGEVDKIYCGVKRGAKKVFKRNNVSFEKLGEHIGRFPVVMISPYDRNLISEGSDTRRKWMDGIIAQTNKIYLAHLVKYLKVVDQRNALLKNMAGYGFFNRESIEIWDEQMICLGVEIHTERKNFLEVFIPIFQRYYTELTGNREIVGLSYKSDLLEGDFATQLKMAEKQDLRKQYSTVGVHKDDLVFTIHGHPVKKFGSQGQQKSFLIALRLAQFEWLKEELNATPILLLDDIFDKLDNQRVGYLMQLVSTSRFGQVFVTDTERARVDEVFDSISTPFNAYGFGESGELVRDEENLNHN
jgi:DNA replication and repair protein RecF